MDRFLGHVTNRIDAKGRVSVPAHFRSIIQKEGHTDLYALRSLHLPALDVGGPDFLDPLRGALSRRRIPFLRDGGGLGLLSPCRRDVPEARPGRANHDQRLHPRAHRASRTEVTFAGAMTHFQMWAAGTVRGSSRRRARPARKTAASAARRCAACRRRERNDGGPRRDMSRRWRTGPPHSGSARRGDGGAPAGGRRRRSSTEPSVRAAIRGASSTAGASVIAIDRDPNAIRDGQALVEASAGRLRLVEDRFSHLDAIAGEAAVDGVVLDIGVSSMQLDEAERGFSFRHDGPLDMRMSAAGPTAADVVNRLKAGRSRPHLRAAGRRASCRPHRAHDREAPGRAAFHAHR